MGREAQTIQARDGLSRIIIATFQFEISHKFMNTLDYSYMRMKKACENHY